MSNTTRKGRKELPINKPTRTTSSKSINNSKSFSIIALSVNDLKRVIKRNRLMDWIEIHDPVICGLQETHIAREKLRVKLESKLSSK